MAKIIEKHKLEKEIKEKKGEIKTNKNEIDELEKNMKNSCFKIGDLIIKKDVKTDDDEIEQLKNSANKFKSKHDELTRERENLDKELFSLEEKLRRMEGKIGCPKCGRIYENRGEILFCSKCGTKL